MRKLVISLLATAITAAICNYLNAQERIAVVDFKSGAGVSQGDTEGVSAIFTTYFADPELFTMVERSQINHVIQEQGFQMTTLTNEDVVRIGQILNLQKMVIGDITVVSGQYNVDVRVIDIETGTICATNGATWVRGSSYRELMRSLANNLKETLRSRTHDAVNIEAPKENPEAVTLLGYLHIYPEDLGSFEAAPNTVIAAVNKSIMYGYNDWRLPNSEEMFLIKGNAGQVSGISTNATYMTSDKATGGRVRLVSTGDNYEAKQQSEQKAREKQAQVRREQEARAAAYRDKAQRQAAAREQALSQLSKTDKIRYLALTRLGIDIKYTPKVNLTNYPEPIFRDGEGTELNYTDNRIKREGWKVADYEQLTRIPELKDLLQSCKFWYTDQFLNTYDAPYISVNGRQYCGPLYYLYLYNSQSNSLTKEVILFCTRQELGPGNIDPNYVMFYNECSISAIYVKQLSGGEGNRIAAELIQPYLENASAVNTSVMSSKTDSVPTTCIDYDYVNNLVKNHPQIGSIQNQLTNFMETAQQEYDQLVQTYVRAVQGYQQYQASWMESERQKVESQLLLMEERVNLLQETAVKNYESQERELMRPVLQSIYTELTAIASGQNGPVGYVDSDKIIFSMAEYNYVINELNELAATHTQELDKIKSAFEEKQLRYQQEEAGMSSYIRESRQKELIDLNERYNAFIQAANDEFKIKQTEAMKSISDKALRIIKQYGSENGYAYIFYKEVMDTYKIPADTMTDLTVQIIANLNTM